MLYNLETIYRRTPASNSSLEEALKTLKIKKEITLIFLDNKRLNKKITLNYTDKHYFYSPKWIAETIQLKFLNCIKKELIKKWFKNSNEKTKKKVEENILDEKSLILSDNKIKKLTIDKDITDEVAWHQYEEQIDFLRNSSNVKMINKLYKNMSPREHQLDAIRIATDSLINKYKEKGTKWKGMLVLPTWFWKTFISAAIANELKNRTDKKWKPFRVLFLVHKNDIIYQTATLYSKWYKWPFSSFFDYDKMWILIGWEKDFQKCIKNVFTGEYNELVIANIKTLTGVKETLPKDHFDLIIADECHRSIWAMYKDCINYFDYKYLLWITATPSRTDELAWLTTQSLYAFYDNNEMYKKELLDVIENKILATPIYFIRWKDHSEEVENDIRKQILFPWYKPELKKETSYTKKLEIINTDIDYLNKEKKKTIVFCENIDVANEVYKKIHKWNKNTIMMFWRPEYQNAKWKTIKQVWTPITTEIFSEKIKQFKEHDTEKNWAIFLVVVDLFIEWTDIPEVNAVMLLRPTGSERIYFQILWRWLRKTETKTECLVFDYNFETIKLSLLDSKIKLLETIKKFTKQPKYQKYYELTEKYVNSIQSFINDFKNNVSEKEKYSELFKKEVLSKEVIPRLSFKIKILKNDNNFNSFFKEISNLKYIHPILGNKFLFSRWIKEISKNDEKEYFEELYSKNTYLDILNYLLKTSQDTEKHQLFPLSDDWCDIKLSKEQEKRLKELQLQYNFSNYKLSPLINSEHIKAFWTEEFLITFFSRKTQRTIPLISKERMKNLYKKR